MNAMKTAVGELKGTSATQAAAAPLATLPAGQAIVASPQAAALQPSGSGSGTATVGAVGAVPVNAAATGLAPTALPTGASQTLADTAQEVAPIGTPAATPVKHLKASSLTAKQKAAVKARVAAQEKQAKATAAKLGVVGAATGATAATGAIGAVGATGAATPATGITGVLGTTSALPANATQLPNATVYSYDQNGNPAVAGLQGLPATTQSQLGILPQLGTSLDGLTGQTAAANVPQMNQTNQTSVPTGAGVNGLGVGTSVPTLGQAIYNPAVTPESVKAAADAAAQPASGTGATQAVTNKNSNDQSSLNQGSAYGLNGYGAGGLRLPYGSSMTGYSTGQQGGISGFFSRLFG
jgi:hypothetical protein